MDQHKMHYTDYASIQGYWNRTLTHMQTHGWPLQSFHTLIFQKPGILKAQLLSSWYGCWKTRGRRGCLQLFLVARKQNWREESRGAMISLEISIGGKSTIGRFQLFRLKIK